MDAAEYQEELEKCRERLAKEMDLPEVPNEVWGYVDKCGLVYDAITGGDKESWKELEEEAKARHRESLVATGFTLPPGRKGTRGAPREAVVEFSEGSAKRAEALTEAAALMANEHPNVQKFRKTYLRNRVLSDHEARKFLDAQEGPYGAGPTLGRLLKLAARLSKTYRWREGDAAWFVLTGHAPPVRPLEVSMSVNPAAGHPGSPPVRIPGSSRYIAGIPRSADYQMSTARITVTAHAWVDAREVERAYRDAQRQVLGGDARQMKHRTLEAAKFIAQRKRNHPEETWADLLRAWNEFCPTEWRYKDFRDLRRIFERLVHPTYHVPSYRLRERTPYEKYRDDWEDRHTGAT